MEFRRLTKPRGRFFEALLRSKGEDDSLLDEEAKRVLFRLRLTYAFKLYRDLPRTTFLLLQTGWEYIYGRYRAATSQDHSGPNKTPRGGAGTAGQSAAQFSVAAVTQATASYGAGGGGGGGVGQATWVRKPIPVGATATLTFGGSGCDVSVGIEDAGIKAGEIVAYRAWKLGLDGKLYSVYNDDYCWEPGIPASGDPSVYGVHAFKSLLLLADYGSSHYKMTPPNGEQIVTGTVFLWGEVFEHERGYRASRAAIRSIDDSPDYDAKALRRLYGLNKRGRKAK